MWRLIMRIVRWVHGRLRDFLAFERSRPDDKGPPLNRITNVRTEIDMSGNVLLSWTNPDSRKDGAAVDGSEFEVRIGLKAAAAPSFTPAQVVPGTDTPQATFPNVAGGDYEFEIVLYDLKLDKAYPAIIEPFSVPIDDLNPLTDVTVEVS